MLINPVRVGSDKIFEPQGLQKKGIFKTQGKGVHTMSFHLGTHFMLFFSIIAQNR